MTTPRPFREDDAPGRIPESLIDAVLDGSVDDRTRREVARALRHDPRRRRDVDETLEALGALRRPVDCPDFASGVLTNLDRRNRFLPARARRAIRRGRAGLALAAMVALAGVAVAQRTMPRLASLGAQATPVTDVASAVTNETATAADELRQGVRVMQASLPGLSDGLRAPGARYEMTLTATHTSSATASQERGRMRIVGVEGGRYFILEATPSPRCVSARGGVVSMLCNGQSGTGTDDRDDAESDPLP